ncbi:MAG: MBL fold metallo-hydrolase [Desulfobacteraceae bacterium]|nr:MAG: MBL fold metallo-hydrolase [Desulfobacteraceae bacterium]
MFASATIQRMDENLYLVPLPVPIAGFEGFITAWIYTGGPVALIDVGPSSTKDHLISALDEIGVRHLDWILLTHVHLDHSGAIGHISRAFSKTPVVCHPKAAEHLIEPQRLWEGSVKTLGEVAHRYGPIAPVADTQVLTADQLRVPEIIPIATPGHAPHHYCYFIGDVLFAGEAGGVCLPVSDTRYYMRPATPPRFILEIYLDSIDRLIARQPQTICYGHVGMRPDASAMLQTHSDQLRLWQQLVKPFFASAPEGGEDSLTACLAHMLDSDPLLSGFSLLSPAAQDRERFFLRNSLKGYWGYFRDKDVSLQGGV